MSEARRLLAARGFSSSPGVARRGRSRRSSRATCRSAVRLAPRGADAPRFDLVGLHWRGAGSVELPHAQRRRALERLAAGRARGRGPARSSRPRARAARLAARQPVLDGRRPTAIEYRLRRGRHAGCAPSSSGAPASGAAAGARRWRLTADRDAARVEGERDRSGAAPPEYAPAVRFAVVHHTAGSNDVHARAVGGDRARHPALPRAGRTAGTTSATTSSSTSTARSSRAATAGSTGTSSARTPRASTPARSASP